MLVLSAAIYDLTAKRGLYSVAPSQPRVEVIIYVGYLFHVIALTHLKYLSQS